MKSIVLSLSTPLKLLVTKAMLLWMVMEAVVLTHVMATSSTYQTFLGNFQEGYKDQTPLTLSGNTFSLKDGISLCFR